MMEFRLSASMISCLICLRQINIDFHNTNFRLMGDYEKFVEAFDAFIKSKDTNRNETLFQSIEQYYRGRNGEAIPYVKEYFSKDF